MPNPHDDRWAWEPYLELRGPWRVCLAIPRKPFKSFTLTELLIKQLNMSRSIVNCKTSAWSEQPRYFLSMQRISRILRRPPTEAVHILSSSLLCSRPIRNTVSRLQLRHALCGARQRSLDILIARERTRKPGCQANEENKSSKRFRPWSRPNRRRPENALTARSLHRLDTKMCIIT